MKSTPKVAVWLLSVASIIQVACVAAQTEEDELVGEVEQAVPAENHLDLNGLSDNGLSDNGLSDNGLSDNGLSDNGLLMEQLKEPGARELLRYVVSCALEEGAHFDLEIEGVTYGFDGSIGLAPEWEKTNGRCDSQCRSWVSACVLSRVNYLGEHVTISLRGKDDALSTTAAERATYSHREATYYGNIFTEPKQLYACLSPGETQIPRLCGPSIDGCIATVVGDCDAVCRKHGPDGSFDKCQDAQGRKHKGAVTVYLKP